MVFFNVNKNKIYNIEYANSSLKTNKVFISMAVQNSNKVLNDILTKSIKDIKQDQHEAIRNKWVPIIIDKKVDWTLVWQVSLGIGIFIIMLLYKQVSLRKINEKLSKQKDEIEEANKKLKELSELDHLTELYNRRFFEESIEKVLEKNKQENKPSSLIMLDIDDFKSINDNYGHKGGDEVLKKLSYKLKTLMRKDDLLARTGGEEFMILLPNTTFDEGQIYAENIRNSIENLQINLYDDLNINITVSIGLTSYDENEDLSKLLIRVDNNLYEAKTDGKNRVVAK